VSIHTSDPFATPEDARSPVRRLRGRLPAAVTLWTARNRQGTAVGLTVSSTMVVEGVPGRVLGLIDPESSLWEAVEETGQFAMAPLREADRRLADAFAGLFPAPGGPFTGHGWRDTEFGPVLAELSTWAGCRLASTRPCGWALLVEATVEQAELGAPDAATLLYYRGRYHSGPGV
jgi:3-hydroxy-9,10-secoandrosta-1,3,5(10)-triene-9,17-dione monooxygenase reductase component